MSIMDRLLGKQQTPFGPMARLVQSQPLNLKDTSSWPIEGPPGYDQLIGMQRDYWTPNRTEMDALEARGYDNLDWPERLRLHHLICLQRLESDADSRAFTDRSREMTDRLLAKESPYRIRPGLIWRTSNGPEVEGRKPDHMGQMLNMSITHLGCLETYYINKKSQIAGLAFVPFDDFGLMMFGAMGLIRRGTVLDYNDEPPRTVLVPSVYGLTWRFGEQLEREARAGRFVANIGNEGWGVMGIGIGAQALTIRADAGLPVKSPAYVPDTQSSIHGFVEIDKFALPVEMSDPRFVEKAHHQGIDPVELRRSVAKTGTWDPSTAKPYDPKRRPKGWDKRKGKGKGR